MLELATNTTDGYITGIQSIQKNIGSLAFQMQSATASMGVFNSEIKRIYSKFNIMRDVLKPVNMEYLKSAVEIQKMPGQAIGKVFENHRSIFNNELKKILKFEYRNKMLTFLNIQQSINNRIKPFLFDTEAILVGRTNVKHSFEERAKTMLQFGWWFIGSLPIDIVNNIYNNQEKLTQEDVDKIICNHYKENSYNELEKIIVDWNKSGYFNKWSKKIEDAIYAHKLGMYTLSVPVWTLLIE